MTKKAVLNIAYPFTGTLVGGSYVVAAIQAILLEKTGRWSAMIYLPHSGPNVEVFKTQGHSPVFYGLSEAMVKCIRAPVGFHQKIKTLPVHLWIILKAFLIIMNDRPDLLVVHDRRTLLSWGIAARLQFVPVIWHVHQEKGEKVRDWMRLKLSKALVLNSNATLKRFSIFNRLPCHVVVHNSINTNIYYPPADKANEKLKWGLAQDKIVIGFVGSLVDRKRPRWMFDAAVFIRENKLNALVVLAGEDLSNGKYLDILNKQYSTEIDAGVLRYLGYIKDIPSLMKAFDIYAMPSYQESFGLVYGEAMATEVPSIGCKVGGVPEVIVDGETGCLIEDGNKEQFFKKLYMLIKDEEFRNEMGINARKYIVENYSEQKMLETLENFYIIIMNHK